MTIELLHGRLTVSGMVHRMCSCVLRVGGGRWRVVRGILRWLDHGVVFVEVEWLVVIIVETGCSVSEVLP